MRLQVAVKAGLRREEVVAVVLYTGPMVDALACASLTHPHSVPLSVSLLFSLLLT